MQSALPDLMDLSGESKKTLEMYGVGDGKISDNFGRQCLMARRFAEAGVRYKAPIRFDEEIDIRSRIDG